MPKLKEFWTGELVQTGPDTWEVKHPEHKAIIMARTRAKNKAKGIVSRQNEQRRVKVAARANLFFDRKSLCVVNLAGTVCAENVVVTATKKVDKFEQVLVRFVMNDTEYSGKTRPYPPNALIIRKGKSARHACSKCKTETRLANKTGLCKTCSDELNKNTPVLRQLWEKN
jgi:hypothetical protein